MIQYLEKDKGVFLMRTLQEVQNKRAEVKWVSIQDVIPNPLNPRKNDSYRTEEIQSIIQRRGWEEPLTVYQKGKIYVLLAGHRRLYAAKKIGIKEVPVYIVEKPENYQEEIERIASLQSGRADWTAFEWAKFTYERWVAWGKPDIKKFAKQINLKPNQVTAYVSVLSYFARNEIEQEIENGTYSITALYELFRWMKAFGEHKSELLNRLGEDVVRKIMLKKMANKEYTRDHLRKRELFTVVSDEDLLEFLTNEDIKLEHLLDVYNLMSKNNHLHSYLVQIGMYKKKIANQTVVFVSEEEKEKYKKALQELSFVINDKIRKL